MAYALSTDLLRARQLVVELSEKEQEAALAAEAANLGTFTRDIPRDVIEASDEWRELFGFVPDEPLSLGALLQKIHVDDRAAFSESMARSIRGRGEQHVEFRVPLADGRMRWIAAIGRVEFDCARPALRSRGACIDITSRKQAEQEMLRLRQDIAHCRPGSVMGQLASALAHEINQPLSAILRNAEAARSSCRTRRPTWPRSPPSSRTSARTTSAPAPSSTGCAPCCDARKSR
jgi:PAS domain S-box-containing protein